MAVADTNLRPAADCCRLSSRWGELLWPWELKALLVKKTQTQNISEACRVFHFFLIYIYIINDFITSFTYFLWTWQTEKWNMKKTERAEEWRRQTTDRRWRRRKRTLRGVTQPATGGGNSCLSQVWTVMDGRRAEPQQVNERTGRTRPRLLQTDSHTVNPQRDGLSPEASLRPPLSAAVLVWLLNRAAFTVWPAGWNDPPPALTRPNRLRDRVGALPSASHLSRRRRFQWRSGRTLTLRLSLLLPCGSRRSGRGATDVPVVVKSSTSSGT